MTFLQAVCFAFATGLTLSGIASSLMQLLTDRPLSFSEPYVSSRHLLRSLASTASAGPFMLGNEALESWRRGRLSWLALASCLMTSFAWALSIGILAIDLAAHATRLLS